MAKWVQTLNEIAYECILSIHRYLAYYLNTVPKTLGMFFFFKKLQQQFEFFRFYKGFGSIYACLAWQNYVSSTVGNVSIRHLLRFLDCLAHPILSATLATDQKCPLSHLHISYQSLTECH